MQTQTTPTRRVSTPATGDAPALIIFTATTVFHGALRVLGSVAATVAVLALAQPSCFAQVGGGGTGGAMAAAPAGAVAMSAGLESAYVLHGSDGTAYMVVDLAAAPVQVTTTRPGMAVALVIDRSGSMQGPKMANAITAASSFIAGLADGDVVAVYQYDGTVEQVAAPTIISAHTRAPLVMAVQGIYARGSTNLHGGLVAGIGSLTGPAAERPVRRVVLISDGLANVGPATPAAIGAEASRAAMMGISVTTIGVGLDYDESVLAAVAMSSGGRYYHLQEPAQMASILETELTSLGQTVARQVRLDLRPAAGVRVVEATGAHLVRGRGRAVQLHVGDMLGGQARPVVVTLRVPTRGTAARNAADVALHYLDPTSGQSRGATAAVGYALTRDQAAIDGGINPRYAVAIERHRTSTASLEAARLVGSGRADAAGDLLARRASHMRRRASRMGGSEGAALRSEADRVEREERRTRRARRPAARRARQLELTDDALGGLGL